MRAFWRLEQTGGPGRACGRAGAWFHRFHGNQLSGTVRLYRCSPSYTLTGEGASGGVCEIVRCGEGAVKPLLHVPSCVVTLKGLALHPLPLSLCRTPCM